jgi:hypothetical protein
MHTVAQAWLVLSLTNSPLLLGLVNALRQRGAAVAFWGAGGLAPLALLTGAQRPPVEMKESST